MKKALIAFGCLEFILLFIFVLFYASDQYAWAYPLLLTLIGASFMAGILLLCFGKKK